MNKITKARYTRLINWLCNTLGCTFVTRAVTGSCYLEYNTQYTGKSIIRISDHLSHDKTYIHVILSPLNNTVIVNFRNFIWCGSFGNAKQIIYSLIMSKEMIATSINFDKTPEPPKIVEEVKKEEKKEVLVKSEIDLPNFTDKAGVVYYSAPFLATYKPVSKLGTISISKADIKRMSASQRCMVVRAINKRLGNNLYTGCKQMPDCDRRLTPKELYLISKS